MAAWFDVLAGADAAGTWLTIGQLPIALQPSLEVPQYVHIAVLVAVVYSPCIRICFL